MLVNHLFSQEPLLFIVAKNLNYFMIEFFIRNGVDINSTYCNEYLLTILIKNGCNSHFIMKLIQNENIDLNIRDSENNSLLQLLLNYQYITVLYYIIMNKNTTIDLNVKDKNGDPLLLSILQFGFIDLAKFIISLGADINAYTHNGDPIIFKLIKTKRYNLCTVIMTYSDRINIYNKNLYTKLSFFELVVSENLYFYVKHFLEHYNFIIPTKIISSYSLIEIAARNNGTLILHKLIEYYYAQKIQAFFRGYLVRNDKI
jgi:ankyrin repeat protein